MFAGPAAEKTSFPTIIAVGERAALPHAPPTGKRVRESGFLLVDWGASGPLYKSDLTRMLLPRKNAPSPESQSDAKLDAVYGLVLKGPAAGDCLDSPWRPGARRGCGRPGSLPECRLRQELWPWPGSRHRPSSARGAIAQAEFDVGLASQVWLSRSNRGFTFRSGVESASRTMCW